MPEVSGFRNGPDHPRKGHKERRIQDKHVYTFSLMALFRTIAVPLIALLAYSGSASPETVASRITKVVNKSTLNQAGTRPFHLKAELAPSRDSDQGAKLTGTVEYWWLSPTQWRREVHSSDFQQIDIVRDTHEWQKNEGDYFPEWLREVAAELVNPVPFLEQVLVQIQGAEDRKLAGMNHFSWTIMSTDGNVQKTMGAGLSISEQTGLLLHGSGFGWSGVFKDYKDFHGRMVAQTVSSGSPEVTAKVTLLEDLRETPPSFFDPIAIGGDSQLLRTVMVEEVALRKNLETIEPPVWPALENGPLEGVLTTTVVIDRRGSVREVGTIITDCPGLIDTARSFISSLHFKPYLENGEPVQVLSRITMPFKTVRPAGTEAFESARTFFERGRKLSSPAAAAGKPYVLHASFQAALSGGVQEGQYVDSWKSDGEWRREASIANSRYVRARHGETWYQLSEGPDADLLRLVLRALEPIPALDTFVESDWRVKRDTVNGVKTIRVLTGYEAPDGTLDPEQARAYWFDESGKLTKAHFRGLEVRGSDFQDFNGVQIAHQVEVLSKGGLGLLIHVKDVSSSDSIPPSTFEVSGHKWKRAFTDEAR